MNEQESSSMLQLGRECCLEPLERLFAEALQEADFDRAKNWHQEYSGAAKMLEVLRLISREEYRSLTENLFCRLLAARYPDTDRKENINQ